MQAIVDKWDAAVIAGIKNQNAKTIVSEENNNIADNGDVKNQSRNANSDYNFRKALSKNEWASFYASLGKSNQRNSFRIGDNGVLIPNENNSENYKLVCYEGDNKKPRVTAVYKLENYDYNIHDGKLNIVQTIIDTMEESLDEKYRRTILQNYSVLSETVLKQYNRKSGRFIKLTRESVPNREDVGIKSNGRGILKNVEQGVSDSEVDENIEYQQRYVKPASTALEDRLQGVELLDAQDIIDTIKSVGGRVDEHGNAVLYHATSENSRNSIYQSGKMVAKEDGLFFSTKSDGEIKYYGDNIVRIKIPVEYLELNDIFEYEAHFRLPLNSDYSADVSSVLFQHRGDFISNREILANALESTAKTAEEKANLKAYKEGVARLNEDCAMLADINKQIKDISFTKGSDRTQLPKLKQQKKILEDKITRKDKALLKLESMGTIQSILNVEKKKAVKKAQTEADKNTKSFVKKRMLKLKPKSNPHPPQGNVVNLRLFRIKCEKYGTCRNLSPTEDIELSICRGRHP